VILTSTQFPMDSWPPSNFINPERHGVSFKAVDIVFSVAILAVSVLRIYARGFVRREFAVDDLFMGIAVVRHKFVFLGLKIQLAALTGNVIGWLIVYRYDADVHIWDFPLQYFIKVRKLAYISQYCYFVCACATRASVLFFYKRIFSNLSFRHLVNILSIANALYFASLMLILLLECRYVL
jgi:hypothetical protein